MRWALFAVLASCGTTPPAPTCTSGGVLMLAESPDFSGSELGSLPIDGSPFVLSRSSLSLADPVLATSSNRRFAISRTANVINEVDSCGRLLDQYSALTSGDTDANPYDVAVASNGALWITRYNLPSLLVLQPGSPARVIDLTAFDSDVKPDMSSVHVFGDRAFVALERLNPYPKSVQASQMLVLDTNTFAAVTTITLAGRNPIMAVESAGKLWLAEPGNFDDATETTAGIEVVDPSTLTSKLLLPETAFGGSVNEIAVSATCGAAIVAGPTIANPTSLVTFALDGSSVSAPFLTTPDFWLRGLTWTEDGRLLVGDATVENGMFFVRVFSVGPSCALVKSADWPVPMPALAFAN